MGVNRVQVAAAVLAVCWIAGISFGAASWQGEPYSVAIATHITSVGQTPVSGSTNLSLQHDAPCDILVSVSAGGNEVLTLGGRTLTTSYKLQGAAVSNPDADWVSSAVFLTQTYHVLGVGPLDTLTLSVLATPPANRAPDAGVYSASVILTATW
jgi:hypothetical protein